MLPTKLVRKALASLVDEDNEIVCGFKYLLNVCVCLRLMQIPKRQFPVLNCTIVQRHDFDIIRFIISDEGFGRFFSLLAENNLEIIYGN